MKKSNYLMGIDEAGRGPLAGPVVVAGVCIKRHVVSRLHMLRGIKDSKKLSPKKREEFFGKIVAHPRVRWYAARVSPKIIDKINIAQATNRGVRRVVAKLAQENMHVLLDGSLALSPRISHEVIIKGDERVPLIAAASIIAKVTRDRIMRRLHKKFPQYGFDAHKGYGTKAHKECIAKYGHSLVHRLSFLRGCDI
ncbi:MAG: ribonuclease HII [Candidatus Colwellbacteria bacterium]|nr:ribonuclease HII [Candidatus Colwellbacteria bacterium]